MTDYPLGFPDPGVECLVRGDALENDLLGLVFDPHRGRAAVWSVRIDPDEI